MSKAAIIDYYRLCTIAAGGKQHFVSQISELETLLTPSELSRNLRKRNNEYTVNEVVVGGGSRNDARYPVVTVIGEN